MAEILSNSQSLNRANSKTNQSNNESKIVLNQNQIKFQNRPKRSECLTPENQENPHMMRVGNFPRLDSEKRMITDPSF